MNRANNSHGFSLIEVLITMFVVAVGLLGIAGLQTFSKKSNFDAVQRTTAAALAQDIIERMRANPTATATYAAIAVNGISESNPISQGTDCKATGAVCSNAQLAAYDMFQWSQALQGAFEVASDGTNAGGLSSATGCITALTTPACGLYTVTIAWRGVTPLSGAALADQCGVIVNGAPNPNYLDADGKPLRRIMTVQAFIDPGKGTPC